MICGILAVCSHLCRRWNGWGYKVSTVTVRLGHRVASGCMSFSKDSLACVHKFTPTCPRRSDSIDYEDEAEGGDEEEAAVVNLNHVLDTLFGQNSRRWRGGRPLFVPGAAPAEAAGGGWYPKPAFVVSSESKQSRSVAAAALARYFCTGRGWPSIRCSSVCAPLHPYVVDASLCVLLSVMCSCPSYGVSSSSSGTHDHLVL
jgi:hypothetical protein